ncbi:MAG: hypothetical protein JKP95_01030 [Oceanicaulis sp.]|nr:hypothetical protein [Oceanicaulis sp.]
MHSAAMPAISPRREIIMGVPENPSSLEVIARAPLVACPDEEREREYENDKNLSLQTSRRKARSPRVQAKEDIL